MRLGPESEIQSAELPVLQPAPCPCPSPIRRRRGGAFTLIEIMVVVAIMGLILGAAVPSLYPLIHKAGFRKTLSDLLDVCNATRAQAILQGKTESVVFHPLDGTFEGGGKSGRIQDATIEMLDVNLAEFKDQQTARVRFFPDGRCDEMTLVLHSNRNQWRTITLEITTGIATVSDKLP